MKENKTKQKFALVTGGSRGIGRAICIQLAKDLDYNLIINYNGNKEAALQTQKEVEELGGKGEVMQFDVSDSESVNKAFDLWHESNKDAIIEVIVNNAGRSEEHTSELQSRPHLVCRLLLEKKKKKKNMK